MRIGIDVGGTHTDAVILDGDTVIAATKQLTTSDVVSGIVAALDKLIGDAALSPDRIETAMIGTTQFTNAIVQRRELCEVAAVRICLPAGRGFPPMIDWPEDAAAALGGHIYMLHGGHLYDGNLLADLRDDEIDALIADLQRQRLSNVAISATFSPMNKHAEEYVAARIRAAIPDARVTCSHKFGRLGLMERENAAIMNSALLPFAANVVDAFLGALKQRGLHCPAYISQNDGTLMSADFVRMFPALTFASGPTNSLRGAFKLTGLEDAIVVDIGGTTSDIGVLQGGFPRESNVVIEIGGVRTNFRMPDIVAVGLGGGSIVSDGGSLVGPQSVGHELVTKSLVFGGDTLTATDIVVGAKQAEIGDARKVASLDPDVISRATATMHETLNRNIEMMRPGGREMPVILVGGGALLVTQDLDAASEVHRPENAGVANAIGAAIAQIGGEAERMLSYRETPRAEAIAAVTQSANARAIQAGADADSLKTVDIEETAVPYMSEGATRVRVKVIGDLQREGQS